MRLEKDLRTVTVIHGTMCVYRPMLLQLTDLIKEQTQNNATEQIRYITFQKKTLLHSHVDCRPIPNTCAQKEDKTAETILLDDSPGNTQ